MVFAKRNIEDVEESRALVQSSRTDSSASTVNDVTPVAQTVPTNYELVETLSDLLADALVADFFGDLIREGRFPRGNQP
jgi:hypothetical protein